MKNPLKIIHKFKNNNRRIQYKVYIFIGNIIDESLMKILNNIQDKDLLTTFNLLSTKEIKELESFYGKKWYEFFFISDHINFQINSIKSNNSKRKALEIKLSKEWVDDFLDEPVIKKVSYSYSSSYYNYLLAKNKIKTLTKKNEVDFRTYQLDKSVIIEQDPNVQVIDPNLLKQKGGVNFSIRKLDLYKQFGAQVSDDELDIDSGDDDDVELPIIIDDLDDENKEIAITEDQLDEEVEGDFNLEELNKMYISTDI